MNFLKLRKFSPSLRLDNHLDFASLCLGFLADFQMIRKEPDEVKERWVDNLLDLLCYYFMILVAPIVQENILSAYRMTRRHERE